jgi:hypothetical protein
MKRAGIARAAMAVAAMTMALGGSALTAPDALSLAPERHVLSFDELFSTEDFCGFPTRFEWVGTGYGTVFTDADGNFVRQRDRIGETLTVSHPAADTSVSGSDHYSIQFRASDGTFTRVGLWFHLTLRGGGLILHDVGRVVFDDEGDMVFDAGQHQWLSGDVRALCDALA